MSINILSHFSKVFILNKFIKDVVVGPARRRRREEKKRKSRGGIVMTAACPF